MRKEEVKIQAPEYEQGNLFGGEKTHELGEVAQKVKEIAERVLKNIFK